MRYHKKIFYPKDAEKNLASFNNLMNKLKFRYSAHCIDNIKYRFLDLENLLLFIKSLTLNEKDIFEYYIDDKQNILKVCYRIAYTKDNDIIMVLSHCKEIITLYINEATDKHISLSPSLYNIE